MALATLSIDLVAKLGELQAGMDKAGRIAEKSAAQIESRFAAIKGAAAGIGAALAGAVSVAALKQFFTTTVDGLDALNDLADATGSTIENISALEDVAARTGTSLETVGTALVKLNKALGDAKPGSPQAAALKSIGLEAEQLKKLDPAEALLQVSVALNDYADDANKARLVQELFGKSLKEVAPLLKDLAESGKLNATVTADQARQAEKFNKELANLQKNTTDVARAIAGPLLKALNDFFGVVALAKGAGFSGFLDAALAFNTTEIGRLDNLNGRLSAIVKKYADIKDIIDKAQAAGKAPPAELVGQLKALERQEAFLRQLQLQRGGGRGVPTAEPLPTVGEGVDPKARQAQLEALLADFQRQFGLTTAAINAGEQVLQSNRSSNLLADKAYYDAKRALLKADEQAQISVLQREIGALADYKNKVGNAIPEEQQLGIQRQIADKAAKISEIRIKAGAALAVINENEQRDLKAVKTAFEQAQASAEVYLGKLFEAQQADLAGQGQGDAQRRRSEGALAIERDYKSQIEALDQQRIAGRFANDKEGYAKELQLIEDTRARALGLYEDYYAQLEAKQGDASLGAQRAIQNYLASARDVAAQTEQAYTKAFSSLEDALVEFAQTGKLNFKDLANSIVADLIRIQIRAEASKLFGNGSSGNTGSALAGLFGTAVSFLSGSYNANYGNEGRRVPLASGMDYVPFDGFPATLHKGERVLTRSENARYSGSATTINAPITIMVQGNVDQRTAQQIGAETARAVARASARNS